MDKKFHPTYYKGCNYLSVLGLKLNHVSKSGHWCQSRIAPNQIPGENHLHWSMNLVTISFPKSHAVYLMIQSKYALPIKGRLVMYYKSSYMTIHNALSDVCYFAVSTEHTSNGSWCMGIKGEMSGTVCVTFTWYMYIYELFVAFVCFVVSSVL